MEDNKEEITLFDDSGNEDQKQQTDKDELIFSGDVESLLKKEKKPTQSKNIKFSVKFKFSLLTAIIIVILTLAISINLKNIIKTKIKIKIKKWQKK